MRPRPKYQVRVFPVAAIVFAGTLLVTYLVGMTALQRGEEVDAERAIAGHLEEIDSHLDEAETGQRSYLLTGDGRYLQVYRAAVFKIDARKGLLRTDATAGALPSNQVEFLLRHLDEKEAEISSILQLRRDASLDAAVAELQSARNRALTDAIHGELEALHVGITARLRRAMRSAAAADNARVSAFVLTIIVNCMFLAWADRRVSRTARAREAAILETTRQKELLETTLACISDGVIVTDLNTRVTFLNPEAERLTGLKAETAVGKPLIEVFRVANPVTRQPAENSVQKVLRSGGRSRIPNHSVLLSSSGEEFPIDQSAAPIQTLGGPLSGAVLVFRDFTNQRRAEETRLRLAAIVESSQDAIISENTDGIIETWNSAAERLFGHKAEEIIGQPVTVLHPLDRLAEADFILERIRQGRPVERTETVRVAKDGRRIPVALSVSPITDESGQIIGASKILQDATEIVAARESLARSKEELEQLVEQRTRKLRETVNELQHVSYSISHDMRAPLRTMGAFAEILMDQSSLTRPSPEEARGYCQRISRAARRMDQLVVDALNYTKVVLQEVVMSPVPIGKVLRDLIDVYPHLHPDRAKIQVEGPMPTVVGNESFLTQCFSNLLDNAVKFVAHGVRPEVRVWAESRGARTRIWVEDNGVGIPKAAQKRLFGMYERLDHSDNGTGMGLAIVRKVVERMNGEVGAESEPGRGSRFWVELPLAPEPVMWNST